MFCICVCFGLCFREKEKDQVLGDGKTKTHLATCQSCDGRLNYVFFLMHVCAHVCLSGYVRVCVRACVRAYVGARENLDDQVPGLI